MALRPVKVKFSTISSRDYIFKNRDKVPNPCVLKADIPFTMRRAYAILKQKEAEPINNGENCTVNLRKRQLETNGETFAVLDGKLQTTTESGISLPANAPKPPQKRTRHGTVAVPTFLGRETTRSTIPRNSAQAPGNSANNQNNT
ncbi:unnamed protein product [Orchesella dallaii]|uniref:Uncharacterized protein n=1 Tax=Orchesella dallaii TaxID=48710 RepID=A0ABP1Q2Y9_9HEXA